MSRRKGEYQRQRRERQKETDEKRGIKRGARGGVKHQPGRGHERKSSARKKERFKRKARRKREEAKTAARRLWEWWDGLRDEQRKLLVKFKPKVPRPRDDS